MCQMRMVVQFCDCPRKNEESDFHHIEIVTDEILRETPDMPTSFQWHLANNGWFLRREEDRPKKPHAYSWLLCELAPQDGDPTHCPAFINFDDSDFTDPNHPHRLPYLTTHGGRFCSYCKKHAGHKVTMTIYKPKKRGGDGGEGPSRFSKSGSYTIIHNGPEIIPGQPDTAW